MCSDLDAQQTCQRDQQHSEQQSPEQTTALGAKKPDTITERDSQRLGRISQTIGGRIAPQPGILGARRGSLELNAILGTRGSRKASVL